MLRADGDGIHVEGLLHEYPARLTPEPKEFNRRERKERRDGKHSLCVLCVLCGKNLRGLRKLVCIVVWINTDKNCSEPCFSKARIRSPDSDPKQHEASPESGPQNLCLSVSICGSLLRGYCQAEPLPVSRPWCGFGWFCPAFLHSAFCRLTSLVGSLGVALGWPCGGSVLRSLCLVYA
jgi:hypothetical protein